MLTVHVERRAICPTCHATFESRVVPAHSLSRNGHCGRTETGATRPVIVFRRDGEEVGAVVDGAEVTGFFTADEVPA